MIESMTIHLCHEILGNHLKNEFDVYCVSHHSLCYGFYCFYSFTNTSGVSRRKKTLMYLDSCLYNWEAD